MLNGRGARRGALLFYLLHLYNEGFRSARFGYASSMAWVLVILAAISIIITFRTSERWVYYETNTGSLTMQLTKSRQYLPPVVYRILNLGSKALGYLTLIALCGFVLMPIGWMLTVALKPQGVPAFTIPPQWFPTQYWEWSNFANALLTPHPAFSDLHCQYAGDFFGQRCRDAALLFPGGFCLCSPAVSRQRLDV